MTAAHVDRVDVSPRCRDGQHDRCNGHLCGCLTCRPRPDGSGGHPSAINARAAKAVALQTERGMNMIEARLLLDMIGAVDMSASTVTPDDQTFVRIAGGAGSAAGKNADAPPCRRAPDQEPAAGVTTPAGLRILPPLATAPVKRPTAKKKPAPTITERPDRIRAAVAVCGTTSGYAAHKRRKEPACQPCKDAAATYQRDYAVRRGHAPRQTPACGTRGGYQRHHRRGEEACPPCKEASATVAREAYRRRHPGATPKRPVASCGSRSGYLRHLRLHEPVCDPCKSAEAAYHRTRRAARRTA